jgi:hypothetical protein
MLLIAPAADVSRVSQNLVASSTKCSHCVDGHLVRAFGEPDSPWNRPHATLDLCDTCGWTIAKYF